MSVKLRSRLDMRGSAPIDAAEENRCASEYVKGRDPRLAERLVKANLRLVVKIARRHCHSQTDIRDLIQEGNLGLVHAVEKFDPSRGVKLSSYASWWIRAYILKYTIENWRLVKTGTTQAQRRLFFGLQKARRKFEARGAEIDTKEIAKTLDVKEKEVVAMLNRFAAGESSLDTPLGSSADAPRTLGDALSDSPTSQPDVQVERAELVQRLRTNLQAFGEHLRGREREIFQRRLMKEDPVTLQSLAVGFGVTRERTRQLESHLKNRIRLHLEQELGDAVRPMQIAA
jgi:RNA polymerase sigma-32 factor